MDENINFIPVTELPEAIGDEVSVLCLENGEMKQKPVIGISSGYDAVIYITIIDGNTTSELVSGSYDAIRAKVLAGDIPNIKATATSDTWHYACVVGEVQVCEDTNESNDIFVQVYYEGDSYWFCIKPDNTIILD